MTAPAALEAAAIVAPLRDVNAAVASPGDAGSVAAPPVAAAVVPPLPESPSSASTFIKAEPATPPALPQSLPEPISASPVSSRPSALPSSLSLPPPPASLSARVVNSIPPEWLAAARRHPASWMVGAPVALASLLILALLISEPPRKTAAPQSATPAAAGPTGLDAAPAAAPPTGDAKPSSASVAELEAKPVGSLSVAELLQLNQARAQTKRTDAQALSQKLEQQPQLVDDEAVQGQLWRLASDPDTADVALGAMARAHAPVGADLLYEVWTSRAVAPATAELARSLLLSRAVRATASPALSAALELSSADNCEAVQAALPKALSDGDRRSLPFLGRLNSHRACSAKTSGDCNPCVSGPVKPVVAAVTAVKRRPAPHYPTR